MRLATRTCAVSNISSPCHHYRFRSIGRFSAKRHNSNNSRPKATFEGYIEDALNAPLFSIRPATRTQPTAPPPEELPKTAREETLAKARVVFGSRLAGPVERRDLIKKLSTNVAGVLVPPKPEEPDNCCMSGCVNCVWDRYRDELEEWAEQSAKARMAKSKLNAQQAGGGMDDDGGGSQSMEGSVIAAGDLFGDIPVGIREFMRTEKKLKERHRLQAEAKTQAG